MRKNEIQARLGTKKMTYENPYSTSTELTI